MLDSAKHIVEHRQGLLRLPLAAKRFDDAELAIIFVVTSGLSRLKRLDGLVVLLHGEVASPQVEVSQSPTVSSGQRFDRLAVTPHDVLTDAQANVGGRRAFFRL